MARPQCSSLNRSWWVDYAGEGKGFLTLVHKRQMCILTRSYPNCYMGTFHDVVQTITSGFSLSVSKATLKNEYFPLKF